MAALTRCDRSSTQIAWRSCASVDHAGVLGRPGLRRLAIRCDSSGSRDGRLTRCERHDQRATLSSTKWWILLDSRHGGDLMHDRTALRRLRLLRPTCSRLDVAQRGWQAGADV